MNDYIVFIISHGRANNVITYETLKRHGYSGDIHLIIDNTDKQAEEYKKKFKNVIVFNKQEIAKTTDNGDNFNNLRTTTHARNACFNIAKEMGFKYFLVLDDDYTGFQFRFNKDKIYKYSNVTNLNNIFKIVFDFLKYTPTLSINLAQGGDFFGGGEGQMGEKIWLKRKAMNSWFCSTEKPFKFISRLNEDVNTYLTIGNRGGLFFTTNQVSLNQKPTQLTAGGMSEAYLEGGTFVKSFYSVMYLPSAVKIKVMGMTNMRIHHSINSKNAYPKILNERYKK